MEEKVTDQMTIQKPKKAQRMANLELLRCIAMMMVIVLHYLGKSELLVDLTEESLGSVGTAAWFLESFCIVAVNAYMLISGYFLCMSTYKVSRLIKLYLQVWFYSVGVGVLAIATGIFPRQEVTIHDLLTFVFPVSMEHYWFITAYVFLYILLPFMGGALRRMTKGQMQIALGTLLAVFCVLKSVLLVRLEKDLQGYDCLWYLCVFVTAAYLRRFGLPFLQKMKNSLLLYVGGCVAVFGLTMGLRQVYLRTGSLDRILGIGMEYNHVLPFLAAVGLFGLFALLKVGERAGTFINKIAPYTLGVYLLHEHIGLRYAWQNWLGAEWVLQHEGVAGILALAAGTLAAVTVVFGAGILFDMLREKVMKGLHFILMKVGLYRRIVGAVEKADNIFAE
ncbi:MAG: acyltransferase [Lachnospiraceae bacterium]|nr:acyltransferase [Lachnospiraceae bacterium]